MSGRIVGRFTVGRLMALIAALAVLLAAGMYRSRNADVDRATISANLWNLRRGDAETRRQAALSLHEIKPTDPAPVEAALCEAVVGDGAFEVREAAVMTLGWIVSQTRKDQPPGVVGGPDADFTPTRAILRALSDPRTEVRNGAVQAVMSVQGVGLVNPELTSAIIAKLLGLLEDPDPWTRMRAVSALGWTKPAPVEARGRVLSLMEHDPDAKVRTAATQALVVGRPSVELYPILIARQKDAATRSEQSLAIRILVDTIPPPPEIIPALVDLMETDEEAAWWVLEALGKLGQGARPWLGAIGRVAEKEVQVYPAPRYNGINALLKIDPSSPEAQRLLGPISRHLRDATVDVDRQQLVWLLDRYGKSAASAVPTLREALQSPVAGVRVDAARILGGLGPASEPAIADLEPLSRQDPDPSVRASALRALEKLREPPDGPGSSGTPVEK